MKEQFDHREYSKEENKQKFLSNVRKVLEGEVKETSLSTKDPDELKEWIKEEFGKDAEKLTIKNLRGVQYGDKGDVVDSDYEVIIEKRE